MKKLYFFSTLMFILLTSCKEETINPANLHGNYRGVFIATDHSIPNQWTGPVNLTLHETGFNCEGNPNLVPAGGTGNYVIKDGKLVFNELGIWKGNINKLMVLTGSFEYEYNGAVLTLTRRDGDIELIYELEKE